MGNGTLDTWEVLKSEEAYAKYRDEFLSRVLFTGWESKSSGMWIDEPEPYVAPAPVAPERSKRVVFPSIAK